VFSDWDSMIWTVGMVMTRMMKNSENGGNREGSGR
jgi:hypothetical protein